MASSVRRRNAARYAEGESRPRWIAQPERGQRLAIRVIVWFALKFGRTAARALLYPIASYFLIFSVTARAASRQYLRKVLCREPGVMHLFRHYHTFASTILDRVFFLHGLFHRFDVRVHNKDIVREARARGEGSLLLGAHLGSFEVIRSLGRQAGGVEISMVMYEENARKLNSVLAAINPEAVLDVIALGKVDSMLRVQNALARGELVGMLADRTIAGEGTITLPFLGTPARFPLGPFRIAAMLKRPVILMFGLYRGGNRYDIFFEHLVDMRHVERTRRDAVLDEAMRTYVKRLEHYCRVAPYNWFNFYDYWT